MTDYVWVYMSRNGNHHVYKGDSEGFAKARAEQDADNRVTVEEILAENELEVGGSEESGQFYIDDGGDITRYEVE